MAANAAVAAARLGAAVEFWGRAGNDRAGESMHVALAEEGIDVAHFRLFDGAASSVSCVLVEPNGERTIVNFRGASLPAATAWLPLEKIVEAQAVLADPRWPEGALALFGAARQGGVPTVLDGDVADAQVFDGLLPLTDYAIFSAPGLDGYVASISTAGHHGDTGVRADETRSQQGKDIHTQLAFARSRGCRLAAVTLGARGLAWLDDDGYHHIDAFAVDSVDTTGAGDIFHGAFTYAIACQLDLRDAFVFASAVAACKCLSAGSRTGAPGLEDALQFLHRMESN